MSACDINSDLELRTEEAVFWGCYDMVFIGESEITAFGSGRVGLWVGVFSIVYYRG